MSPKADVLEIPVFFWFFFGFFVLVFFLHFDTHLIMLFIPCLSGNCLIDSWRQREPPGQQQRTWQDLGRIVENDDEEYFEDVQVTCKDCRHNAFLTAYAE